MVFPKAEDSKNGKRPKRPPNKPLVVPKRYALRKNTPRRKLNILDLPDDILHEILSYLYHQELYYNVRPVCKAFANLAMHPVHWTDVVVNSIVPTDTLKEWIRASRNMKTFVALYRYDGDVIAEELSTSCKELEEITLHNVWGSDNGPLLHSAPLCHLASRCPKLTCFNLVNSKFRSCKFFRLFSRVDKTGHIKKKYYSGPMSTKQREYLLSILNPSDSRVVFLN